jgi:hypothetical protein
MNVHTRSLRQRWIFRSLGIALLSGLVAFTGPPNSELTAASTLVAFTGLVVAGGLFGWRRLQITASSCPPREEWW